MSDSTPAIEACAVRKAFGQDRVTALDGVDLTDAPGTLAASLDPTSPVKRPALVVRDERTSGLDPAGRQQLWAILTELKAAGTTMLLTTQYLEEADRFADLVHVLDHGKIIAFGTPEQLKERAGGDST